MEKIMTVEKPGEITIFFDQALYPFTENHLSSVSAAIINGALTDAEFFLHFEILDERFCFNS